MHQRLEPRRAVQETNQTRIKPAQRFISSADKPHGVVQHEPASAHNTPLFVRELSHEDRV